MPVGGNCDCVDGSFMVGGGGGERVAFPFLVV